MDENEFYVAIQGVMTAAKEAGWDIDHVYVQACDAALEWISEHETEDFDAEVDHG